MWLIFNSSLFENSSLKARRDTAEYMQREYNENNRSYSMWQDKQQSIFFV